ncbi:MAG: hypothetical protein ABSF95_20225 [Verrucomicrobiota bacterium]|jgi:hypothetical protein
MKLHRCSNDGEAGPVRLLALRYWLAGLLAFALAAGLFLGDPFRRDAASALSAKNTSPAKRLTLGRYLRTGLWRADARTLVAVGRWLLQPASATIPGPTNTPWFPPMVNTNSSSGVAA